MSGSNLWLPLVIIIAAGICLYALYTSWDKKCDQLTTENKELQKNLSKARNECDEAKQQLESMKDLREEDDRRAASLSRQMREFQEQNRDILGNFNPDVKTVREDDQILKTLCDEDWKNIQNILAHYKRQLEEKERHIAILLEEQKGKKESDDPPDAPDKPAGIVPRETVDEILTVYQVTWNKLCDDIAADSRPASAVAKRLRVTAYNHCLAKVFDLKKLTRDKTVERDVYRRILTAYRATDNRRKFYLKPMKKNGDPESLANHSSLIRAIASWIIDLQERKQRIEKIHTKRQKGKLYDANVIRVSP